MLNPMELAGIIRVHRKAAKLSQLQLAELAGVGKTVIFDTEKGKETVKLSTLRKVLEVLNVEVKYTSPLLTNLDQDHEKS